jgi:sulfate permease, SulP family
METEIPAGRERLKWAMRQGLAGTAIAAMSIPQGVAYAMIAGLPPAMGLYAGMLPAVVASLTRSSGQVVTGPTNAISLLFATSVAASVRDPVMAAGTLALLTGILQIGGGLFRGKALVDFVSTSVVLGYITGAAVLIAVGQLPALTGTAQVRGDIVERLWGWALNVHGADPATLAVGLGTIVFIIAARGRLPKGVTELAAMGVAMAGVHVAGLDVRTVADMGAIPHGLPPLAVPSLEGARALLPAAGAAAVLSMVESTSVARSIASRTGQQLDLKQEFIGQGLGNLMAAFSGAYPVSGSLSRSGANVRMGGGRVAGALSGLIAMGAVLLLGRLLDALPLAALAGLLVVVAVELLEPKRIVRVLSADLSDRLAYGSTVLGTWFLPLDQAIYLGVGISVALFLRSSRHLVVHELRITPDGRVVELDATDVTGDGTSCCSVRVLNIEGPLFFASANELEQILASATSDRRVATLVLRLRRATELDYTAASVLLTVQARLAAQGRTLMLVGVREEMIARMKAMKLTSFTETGVVFPASDGWFLAMREALAECVPASCPMSRDCPMVDYIRNADDGPPSRAPERL